LWKEWEEEGRVTNNLDMSCDATDRLLFVAATSIIVGDGSRASF
jgi:hypothetical protein